MLVPSLSLSKGEVKRRPPPLDHFRRHPRRLFGRPRGSTPTDTPAGRPTYYSAGEHPLRNGYGVYDDGDADHSEPRFRRGSVPVVE